ncbi:OLC1v1024366C3 [Oldenlandia corymbosa var. corymbosa]|uniref:OLC1v1024366C3 n=1 Tax=Oldenlandia corymbosa var. corymbosa TaxID=529605 RepID=A0AAV1C2M4_OLDCO|nr:OLC1v1024366C3 [Oldenlandia corymbosa var. corymbosa]
MAVHLRKQILTLTEAAASKIRHQLEQSQRTFLRFRVKPRGCSGLMYSFELADEKGKLDEVVEDKGVKILVDSKTMMHVIGTKMHFVNDNVRFVICFACYFYYFLGSITMN